MWPFLLMAASTLLSAESKRKAGVAEAEAGAADLMDSALSGHAREKGLAEKWSRTSGKMRSRAAASGVELAGSPLEVLMHSAGQAERDLFNAQHVSTRTSDAARRRMEGGFSAQGDAYLGGMLGLATAAVGAGKDYAGGYKSPGNVAEEDWMKEYGND